MRKNKIKYLYAFIIPILLLFINLLILKILHPSFNVFSSDQILVGDLQSQYSALFSYLKDVFQGSASIFYSFSKNLGGSMMSTFCYYLSSPLNLLLILVSKDHLMDMMAVIILIKIGLCSLFMYIYLSKHFNTHRYSLLIFSVFYALMGYNLVYYFNIMWLDVVYLTPLVILGIDKIVESKSFLLYIITLAIAIMSNFYIAYMLCIFCVIYFIYQLLLKYSFKTDKKAIFKDCKLFICGSLLSGILSSFIIVPGIIELKGALRMNPSYSEFIINDHVKSFLMFISKLFVGNQIIDNVLSKMTPNVYFGLFPLALVILYFINKKISKKEKLLTGIVYLIFMASFCFNFLNLLWHGFSYPNGYAYRFSYLFSFFSLFIACRSLLKFDYDISYSSVIKILLGVIVIILLNIIFGERNFSIVIGMIISFFLIGAYMVILLVINNHAYKKLLLILLAFLMLLELIININTSLYLTTNLGYESSYKNFKNSVCPYTDKLNDENKRIDSMFMFGTLGSFICGNSGLSGALTTHNGNLYQFLYNTGNTVTYSTILNELNNTPVIYTLLGLKYYYGTSDISMIPNSNYTQRDHFVYTNYENEEDDYYIYENNLALSIGYLIENKATTFNMVNSFEYQNEIFKNMTGINDKVLKPYKKTKNDDDDYAFNITNDEVIYVSLKYPIPENNRRFAFITIDNSIYEMTSSNNGIFAIENAYKGKSIDVKVSLNDEVYKYFDYDDNELIDLYYLDKEVFKKGIEKLSKRELNVEKMQNNEFSGTINVDKDNSMLFLSIPYEKGWTVYVDGKKTNYEKLYDTFIGISLNKGNHKIEMSFYPVGLDIGIILSKLGVVLIISYYIFRKGDKYEKSR